MARDKELTSLQSNMANQPFCLLSPSANVAEKNAGITQNTKTAKSTFVAVIANPVYCRDLETYVAGHNRRWINESIPMVSIDTFGLILIDVINRSVKDFYIFDRQYRQSVIKTLSDRWLSIHQYTLNRQYRSSIKPTVQNNALNFHRFLPWRRKNA